MKQLWIAIVLLCAVFGQAWAVPPQKPTAVPELQQFLYSQRGHFEFSKPNKEWVVSFPEHREYETALAYLLNMGYADSEAYREGQKPMIIVRPNTPIHVLLAAYAFDGAVQREVNQSQRQDSKVLQEAIDSVKALVGTILIQVNGLWGYGLGALGIVTVGLIIGVKLEQRSQYPKLAEKLAGVKSGKTFEDYCKQSDASTAKTLKDGVTEIGNAVRKIVNDGTAANAKLNSNTQEQLRLLTNRVAKLEGSLTAQPKSVDNKPTHEIASEDDLNKPIDPKQLPVWKAADKPTNGNGIHATIHDSKDTAVDPAITSRRQNGTQPKTTTGITPSPPPNTEDDPPSDIQAQEGLDIEPAPAEATSLEIETALNPAELMSVLDKKARDEQKIHELHDRIKKGDEGEETVVNQNPKLRRSLGLPGPKEEKIEEKVSAN